MKKLMVLGVALLVVGAISARAADVKDNWAKYCQKCHGEDGKGQTTMGKKAGAKDYTDPKVQEAFKDDKMAKAIKEGVKEGEQTKMKAFGDSLSDEEIKALVAYIRAFKK